MKDEEIKAKPWNFTTSNLSDFLKFDGSNDRLHIILETKDITVWLHNGIRICAVVKDEIPQRPFLDKTFVRPLTPEEIEVELKDIRERFDM